MKGKAPWSGLSTPPDLTLESLRSEEDSIRNGSLRMLPRITVIPVGWEKPYHKFVNEIIVWAVGNYRKYEYDNPWTEETETYWRRIDSPSSSCYFFPRDCGEWQPEYRLNRHMRKKGYVIDSDSGDIRHINFLINKELAKE